MDPSHPVHYTLINGWRAEGDICCRRQVDLDIADDRSSLNRICCSTTGTQCEAIHDPVISKIACCRGRWIGQGKERHYDSNQNCHRDGGYVGRCRGPDSGSYRLTEDLMPEPGDEFRLGALIENRCCAYQDKPFLFARFLKHAGKPSDQTITLLSCCASPTIAYHDRCEIFNYCCAARLFTNNTNGDTSFLCPADGQRMPCCRSNESSYCSTRSCVQKEAIATGCHNVSAIIRDREKAGDFVHKFSDL